MSFTSYAQNKQYYFVYFKDKNCTTYSIDRPEVFLSKKSIARRKKQNIPVKSYDLPVCSSYVNTLTFHKIQVLYTSRWLNGAYVKAPGKLLDSLTKTFTFVDKVQMLRPFGDTVNVSEESMRRNTRKEKVRIEETTYGGSYNQTHMICADDMHSQGFQGHGITIAVLDGGYSKANGLKFFEKLFTEKRVLGTYDFVSRDTNVYDDIQHGTQVLSCMAAYAEGSLIGTAYNANYYLFRTEDDATEYPIEEANWLIAAERADSLGVDVINSSLGYSTFDDKSLSYTMAQMNGKTTIAARAANYCARVGMIVVNSAGNMGDKNWTIIPTPADADSILAVGAVDELGNIASFSLGGPTADGRIKPDVVAKGKSATVGFSSGIISVGNGTSFAAPILCGMVACLWQALPMLSNMQIIDLVRSTSSLSLSPNNDMGYGIPCFTRSFATWLGQSHVNITEKYIIPNPFTNGPIRLILTEKDTTKNVDVEIYDLASKLIYKQFIPNALHVNVLNMNTNILTQGLYYVKITGDDFAPRIIKLVKQ
ncbi:MAG: S8 family serine peptidase [Cytophagales bacterium]|nr:S8 family serine peptidase [Cytophagales bacterium]